MNVVRLLNIFFAFSLFLNFAPLSSQILILKDEGKGLTALTDEDQENYLGTLPEAKEEKSSDSEVKSEAEDEAKSEFKDENEEKQEITMPEIPQPNCKTIFGILHKYQWPSSILFAPKMSLNEKQELFAQEEDAEIKFIQKKISENVDPKYRVIYIPNTVYELFFIYAIFTNQFEKYLRKSIEINNKNSILDLDDQLKNILPMFKNRNEITKNFHFILNKELGKYYLNKKEEYQKKQSEEKDEASFFLYLGANFVSQLSLNEKFKKYSHDAEQLQGELIRKSQEPLLNQKYTIAKTIQLETEARKTNKALLVRCSKGFRQQNDCNFENSQYTILMDSSLCNIYWYLFLRNNSNLCSSSYPNSLTYCSLSYSNSLFCGWKCDNYKFGEGGACTYTYLKSPESYCYILSIDKQKYIKNRINNLFTIAPLMPLAGILGNGEMFHSRTKIALPKISKDMEPIGIKGIFGSLIPSNDYYHYLFIEQNPWTHARLLSHFLGDNIKIIKAPDEFKDAIEEREQVLRKGQHDAAEVYTAIKYGLKFSKQLEKIRARKKSEAEAVAAAAPAPVEESSSGIHNAEDKPCPEPSNKKAKTSAEQTPSSS